MWRYGYFRFYVQYYGVDFQHLYISIAYRPIPTFMPFGHPLEIFLILAEVFRNQLWIPQDVFRCHDVCVYDSALPIHFVADGF